MEKGRSDFPAMAINLLGQRIGPKGQMARQRVLSAARELLDIEPFTIPTLTAVAQRADVTLTIIYRYYRDINALLFDVMQPIRDEMTPVVSILSEDWPGGKEYESALKFTDRHFDYWSDRKGALFVRNSLAELGDAQFVQLRTEWAMPLVFALAEKMRAAHGRETIDQDRPLAGLVISGIERTCTLRLQRTTKDFEVSSTAGAHIIASLLKHDPLAD